MEISFIGVEKIYFRFLIESSFHLVTDVQLALFFFNAYTLRYYLSKPLTSLSCSLNAVFPGLKMWDTYACATAIF
jgi:hypothetical protein